MVTRRFETITLPRPDDFHVHLRQGAALGAYARVHSRSFGRVLAMPNTIPPLVTSEDLLRYRQEAREAAPDLEVLGCFRLMPGMKGKTVEALARSKALAGKYYPDGATTNSAGGLTHWRQAREALAAMEEEDLVLCVHAEAPEAPVLDREEAFLSAFREMREAFPRLRMVLEHVSSAAGVRLVQEAPPPTAATITVQHLLFTLDDLLGGLLKPHLFCKPVLKFDKDRQALEDRVLAGDPRFFFGSDSAPHPRSAKEGPSGCAGAYTAPTALPLLAAWFEQAGHPALLEPFLCEFGRNFYRLPPNQGKVVLERRPWTVPLELDGVVPLMAGQELSWQVVSP